MKALFLFPGYPSHYVGMGKELYDSYRIVQEYFETASNCLNINFVKLCFASSEAELRYTQNVYLATSLVYSAIAAALIQEGIQPSAVAGYLDGEYAALIAAESLSLPDMFYIVAKYSMLYDEYTRDTAFSAAEITGISHDDLYAQCLKVSVEGEFVSIAIKYSETQYAVAGTEQAVSQLVALLHSAEKAKASIVRPGIGLHSMLMDGIKEKVSVYLEKVDFKKAKVPVISGLDGALVCDASDLKKRYLEQLTSRFECDAIVQACAHYDIIIEVGNTSPLQELIKKQYPQKTVVTVKKNSDIQMLKSLMV